MRVALCTVIGPDHLASGSVRDDQHIDREVLRCPAFGRRAAHDLLERRAELLLHEALEGLARLPDVVDVVALFALAGTVDDQPLRRLVFPHGGGVSKHLLGDVIVALLRALRRCRQDSNRHLASSCFRGRRILGRYAKAGRQWSLQVENGRAIDSRAERAGRPYRRRSEASSTRSRAAARNKPTTPQPVSEQPQSAGTRQVMQTIEPAAL